VTTTTDIARSHGHAGPTVCQDCDTADNLHVVVWSDPKTGESGTYLQCCDCGIAAGDPLYVHDDCEPDEPEDDEPDPGLTVRVFRSEAGWVMTGTTPEPCTSNHHRAQDGRPACTAPAVWKVVEEHTSADGFPMLSIGFYCDTDLPDEHKAQAGEAA
jgi:hypothetical protein